MELRQTQRQTQMLTPQMAQSIKILQMDIQELREYVEEVFQENPMLELPEPKETPDSLEELSRRVGSLAAGDWQNAYYHAQDAEEGRGDPLSSVGCFLDEENDLKRYILSQFMGTELESDVMEGVEFLLDRLDPGGFLDESLPELARGSGLPQRTMERALMELQAADPAGVGARDLQECLRLQLERRAGDHRLAASIVEGHLDRLARNQYSAIARALNAEEGEVKAACALIRTLNPKPGSGFSARENLAYITPDVLVTEERGLFEITINDAMLPRLRLSPYYNKLLQDTDDREVREYLVEKANQAKWTLRSIDQRRSTLLRCTRWIVERQREFFRFGPSRLLAVTMGDAAGELGIHESTVSRAVKDKYLQCSRGVYPLSYFFSRSLGREGTSPEAAKVLLRELVEGERVPLSDQKLCEEMASRGFPLSRRTVAKYREELGIQSAAGRKKEG